MQNAGLTQAQKDALAKARENMQPDDKDGINAAREQQKANSSNK